MSHDEENGDLTGRIELELRPMAEKGGAHFEHAVKRVTGKAPKSIRAWLILLGLFNGGGFVASERIHASTRTDDNQALQRKMDVLETKIDDLSKEVRILLRKAVDH